MSEFSTGTPSDHLTKVTGVQIAVSEVSEKPAVAPLCECHGKPKRWRNDPRRRSGGHWACVVRQREAYARHSTSAKRRITRTRYNRSKKGLAAQARYEQGRISVEVAGTHYSYRVPPERKAELSAMLVEQAASMRSAYREASSNGWID